MDRRAELGEFLRSRRALLRPADVGVPDFGGRRRVPGLRRAELAQLAGVSPDYYMRLEQGRGHNVSEAVLDAVARALHLDEVERLYLLSLAKPTAPRRRTPRRQRVRPALRQLMDAMDGVPVYVIGARTEVLAWNKLACALLVDFAALPATERNWARLVFLDDTTRQLFADWPGKARDTVSFLRLNAGGDPDDPQLASLVGELSVKSEDFRRMWSAHTVKEKTNGVKSFHHPVVGDLTLAYETLRLPADPGQVLVAYSAQPGSPDETSLRLLATWSGDLRSAARGDRRTSTPGYPLG